jgi:hypothetical protein
MAEDNEMEKVWLELAEQYKIDELVKFSEFNIQDKLAENSWQVTKFTELYEKETDKLNQIIALKDKVLGERYDHYRFNFDKELKQSEIEKYYLPKDEKIIKLNNIIRKQTYRVSFFQMCVKALDKLQWNMKTFFDVSKKGY